MVVNDGTNERKECVSGIGIYVPYVRQKDRGGLNMIIDKAKVNAETKDMAAEIMYMLEKDVDLDSFSVEDAKSFNMLVSAVWLFIRVRA